MPSPQRPFLLDQEESKQSEIIVDIPIATEDASEPEEHLPQRAVHAEDTPIVGLMKLPSSNPLLKSKQKRSKLKKLA